MLNQAFRGQLAPGLARATVPGPAIPTDYAALVGDVRVQFCLATRDPSGGFTTGITRRNNIGDTRFASLSVAEASQWASGGTNAWNTAHYLNIWCFNLRGPLGSGVFPGTAISPGENGIYLSHTVFGRGHAALRSDHLMGRVAVHEVGHWLNVRHVWGDDGGTFTAAGLIPTPPVIACHGSDTVDDTPNQSGPNRGNPVSSSRVTCNNGPNGDMFMNHMDYVSDDSKLMFSRGQALRMQAIFGPGGYRESLQSSPALNPVLALNPNGLPTNVLAGDRTDYDFRPLSNAVGCGGGSIAWRWTATNGWTVTYPDSFYPEIIPSGNGPTFITLSGTYTNAAGRSFPLTPVQYGVSYEGVGAASAFNPDVLTPAPVFTSAAAARCPNASYTATVSSVFGASSYQWMVPAGFAYQGQPAPASITTPGPTLTIAPTATLAGGIYLLQCRVQFSNGAGSAAAAVPLTVNGGPLLKIVDQDPNQRTPQGIVCQRNSIFLELVQTGPVVPGAVNAGPFNVTWSSGARANGIISPPMEVNYFTDSRANWPFTVTAEYRDVCNVTRYAESYMAQTAPARGGR